MAPLGWLIWMQFSAFLLGSVHNKLMAFPCGAIFIILSHSFKQWRHIRITVCCQCGTDRQWQLICTVHSTIRVKTENTDNSQWILLKQDSCKVKLMRFKFMFSKTSHLYINIVTYSHSITLYFLYICWVLNLFFTCHALRLYHSFLEFTDTVIYWFGFPPDIPYWVLWLKQHIAYNLNMFAGVASRETAQALRTLAQAARGVAASTKEPQASAAMLDSAQCVMEGSAMLIHEAHQALVHPGDAESQQRLAQVLYLLAACMIFMYRSYCCFLSLSLLSITIRPL